MILAQRLEAAGLAALVAAAASEALAEAMSRAELATTSDVNASGSSFRIEIVGRPAELKSDMELLCWDLTIRLGGMMALGVGITLTALRFLLRH